MQKGFLCFETGETFQGDFRGGENKAGEIVFNTSHSGYEEIATDPSYFNQIMICTAPMQGNYAVSDEVWESDKIFINGFIALEIQNSERDKSWLNRLIENKTPVLTGFDTREVVLKLREQGTVLGAIVQAETKEEALNKMKPLVEEIKHQDKDWVHSVSTKEAYEVIGENPSGPSVAVLDFGSKKNILRELSSRCSALKVYPSRTTAEEIRQWSPDGIMLTNGPGDPGEVKASVETVRSLLGFKPIFGICMGHQILSMALGAKTFKLKFGHRGSNHPIKDSLLGQVYMTSQNHGYAIKEGTLPESTKVTHTNLNDNTISGIYDEANQCFSVQFHPESCPGPNDARKLFDYFVRMVK